MAEAEEQERTAKDWVRILLPRVLRAAAWGFIMGGEMLLLLYVAGAGGQFMKFLPIEERGLSYLLIIFIGFEVAIQLLQGTILKYVLSIARTLISMTILVLITDGGLLTVTLQSSPELPLPPEMSIAFTIDFKAVLAVSLLLSLLSIVKNLLQAVEFLSEKEEEPAVPPELP